MVIAAVALFINGFGVYLTMRAGIGAAPWDVFNLGLSGTFHILYGTASIAVSLSILLIDILLKEPIGIAMLIDSIVVGKAVDLFNHISIVPEPKNMGISLLYLFLGMTIMGYTQALYMKASLGCSPRDTLLVGLAKRLNKIPIGVVSIGLLSAATLIGFLLGGPVGPGTVLCALFQGPIMQWAFESVHFDATLIHHQNFARSLVIIGHGMKPRHSNA
ncbi:MAG: hypothetical protein K6A92_04995 [Lachnospiraceae bacterium]|nr:hypothetical protein [Lachnospiraceae bacterium]